MCWVQAIHSWYSLLFCVMDWLIKLCIGAFRIFMVFFCCFSIEDLLASMYTYKCVWEWVRSLRYMLAWKPSSHSLPPPPPLSLSLSPSPSLHLFPPPSLSLSPSLSLLLPLSLFLSPSLSHLSLSRVRSITTLFRDILMGQWPFKTVPSLPVL